MLFVLMIIYYTDSHLLSTLFCKLILCKKWTPHKSGEPITKEKEKGKINLDYYNTILLRNCKVFFKFFLTRTVSSLSFHIII